MTPKTMTPEYEDRAVRRRLRVVAIRIQQLWDRIEQIIALKVGPAGKDGLAGKDGKAGRDGKDGRDGKNGLDGKSGRDGVDGAAGKDGLKGRDGKDGRDGVDGIGVPPGGKIHQVLSKRSSKDFDTEWRYPDQAVDNRPTKRAKWAEQGGWLGLSEAQIIALIESRQRQEIFIDSGSGLPAVAYPALGFEEVEPGLYDMQVNVP